MATFQEQFAARKQNARTAADEAFGDALYEQKLSLENLYDLNMVEQDKALANANTNYDRAINLADTQQNLVKQAQNRFADARNLNRQAGSQQALALNFGNRQVLDTLERQKALAAEEANRQRELVKTNHQNMMRQALADHDYNRAAAILDADKQSEDWLLKNATLYANATGDYSGYEPLYGWDTANRMKWMWVANNPETAYNTGMISSAQYKYRTGYDTPAAKANASKGGGGGYYGGGGGYSSSSQQTAKAQPTANGIV